MKNWEKELLENEEKWESYVASVSHITNHPVTRARKTAQNMQQRSMFDPQYQGWKSIPFHANY